MLNVEVPNREALIDEEDPLYETLLRANWSQKKIIEFHQAVNEWVASQPYTRIVEKNETTGFIEHKLRLVRALSPYIGQRFGDAIHALRSTLDLLMCDLASARGKGLSGMAFPFGNSLKEFESEMEKRKILRKLGGAAVKILRSIQPYSGGDELLFALNQLNNMHKHRKSLKPRGNVVLGAIDFRSAGLGQVEFPEGPWKDDEMVYFRFAGDETFFLKMSIVPQVFIQGVSLAEDEPAVVHLFRMIERVSNIIGLFRADYFPK